MNRNDSRNLHLTDSESHYPKCADCHVRGDPPFGINQHRRGCATCTELSSHRKCGIKQDRSVKTHCCVCLGCTGGHHQQLRCAIRTIPFPSFQVGKHLLTETT